MRYIFGPVASRRFGLSLGIDVSPSQKSCNFDCLYCELGGAKPTPTISNPPAVEEIVKEVEKGLERFKEVEVLTLTANGEPTLYPQLEELVDKLIQIKQNKELLILSNSSTIFKPSIQKSLQKFDIVKLSLDCATPRCFKRLDRPLEMNLGRIIEGMEEFRRKFKGLLVVEVLVVKGINDKEEEFKALNQVLKRIEPDRVDVGTIDRPPAYKVEGVDSDTLFRLTSLLELPAIVVSREKRKINLSLKREELLNLLAHRPLSVMELDSSTLNLLEELSRVGEVEKVKVGRVEFYRKRY